MTRPKLATFKIQGDRWDAFIARATEQGTNASALLKMFIDGYLDGSIDPQLIQATQESQGIDDHIDRRLAPVLRELEELRKLIDKGQVKPRKPQIERTSISPAENNSLPGHPGESNLAIVAGSNANPDKWKDSDAISASTARNRAKAMGWDSASETLDKFWGDRGWVRQGKSNKATWHKDCS